MTVYVTSKGGPRGGTPSWQRAKHLPRIYRFIALALDTAARKEAIETLTWFQVDLERRKIALNPKGRRQTKKRSEEHTSELQSLMRISYAVFCLKKKKNIRRTATNSTTNNKTSIHKYKQN